MALQHWTAGVAGVVLVGLAATGAPAGVIRHDRADSLYTTLANSYPSVGRLVFTDPGNASVVGSASGTLITPVWVLTAGHVSSALPTDNLTFTIDGQAIPIVQRITHPQFSAAPVPRNDIGLLRLATPVSTVTPAQRFTGTAQEEFDIPVTYVGFGQTGTGITGALAATEGTKRAGQNMSDIGFAVGGQLQYLGSDFDDPPTGGGYTNDGKNYPVIGVPTSGTPLTLEYATAPGDSGGGAFIDLGSGPLLAGINSFVTVDPPILLGGFGQGDGNPNSSYSDLIGATRVSFYNSFINSVIPEPGALALFALPTLLLRRRRD